MLVMRLANPRRWPIAAALLISILSQMLWWASPAQAQSFILQLFGLAPAPQAQSAARPSASRQPSAHGTARPGMRPRHKGMASDGNRARSSHARGNGGYTTVCVRMCDGYFFPINNRASRSQFHRDADLCRSRCGMADARLFYYPNSSDMKGAVDLTGRSYAHLPIAFMHRVRRVAGCTCQPAPWSIEAQIRHEGYAIAEGVSLTGTRGPLGGVTVVAGNYSDSPASATASSVPAPMAKPAEQPAADQSVQQADAGEVTEPPAEASAAVTPTSTAVSRPTRQSRQNTTASRPPAAHRVAAPRKQLAATTARPKPARVAAAQPTGSRMVWPGDAPTRMR